MRYSLQLLLLFFLFIVSADGFGQQSDSLDIKIGQMILIGFPTSAVDADVLREVKEGKVGSVIIFEKNIPPVNSFIALKKIIWTYQNAATIPLFVSIDQEGGRVNRLKDKYGFPKSITAEAMGKANTLDSVSFYGEATASTLAGLGINLNFAPVVDLSANRTNPVIVKYGRSFSNNEDSVALLAMEFIRQHRKYGVITSLKHFPGHGSSKDDTHFGIADVTSSWTDRELRPYQSIINAGYADAIMTAHIVNKNLDASGKPGTLSSEMLTGILRKRLHFAGVVFSDDMQMHAITKHFGLEDAIRLAVNGGVDIMTFSNNISGTDKRTVDKVHQIIRQMVEKGEIKRERIDESFRRIMTLKKQLQAVDRTLLFQQSLEQTKTELEAVKYELERKNQQVAELEKLIPKRKRKKLVKSNS